MSRQRFEIVGVYALQADKETIFAANLSVKATRVINNDEKGKLKRTGFELSPPELRQWLQSWSCLQSATMGCGGVASAQGLVGSIETSALIFFRELCKARGRGGLRKSNLLFGARIHVKLFPSPGLIKTKGCVPTPTIDLNILRGVICSRDIATVEKGPQEASLKLQYQFLRLNK